MVDLHHISDKFYLLTYNFQLWLRKKQTNPALTQLL